MNRFAYALEAAKAPHLQSLMELAENFYNAVAHAEAEERDPASDSAVIVIGSFIAFQVHADVNTATGYFELLNSCEENVNNSKDLQ